MKLVGLTGGIASGKSTVAEVLRSLGVTVIDADAIAREMVAPGTTGLAAVVDRFGEAILGPDGALDRGALGDRIVSDPVAKQDLEAITHPRIRDGIAARVAERLVAGDPAVVVEAALLVETGSFRLYDALWVVCCSREKQITRLMKRKGCDATSAAQWVDAQMPMAEKITYATTVIDNDGDRAELQASVERAWAAFMAPLQDPS